MLETLPLAKIFSFLPQVPNDTKLMILLWED